jgi:hypothetical protein
MRTVPSAKLARFLTLFPTSTWPRRAAVLGLQCSALAVLLVSWSASIWANPGLMTPAVPERAAVATVEHWQEAVEWEGRLSTPETDCIDDGLVLAPWGIYPNGSLYSVVVWCVASDIYPRLGLQPWELWQPVAEGSAEGYCKAWHGTGLVHEEPDGRFWCDESEKNPAEDPVPPGGSPDRA